MPCRIPALYSKVYFNLPWAYILGRLLTEYKYLESSKNLKPICLLMNLKDLKNVAF